MVVTNYLTPEEAEEISANMEEWRSTQPEYIAVPFTLEDYKEHIIKNFNDRFNVIILAAYLHTDEYKVLFGELHKKVKNPKAVGVEVIPWNN